MTSSSTTSSTDLADSLALVEVKPGKKFSLATLKDLLPDTESVLFFAKVYKLDAQQVGTLLHNVLATDLTSALFGEGNHHSTTLQEYLIGGVEHEWDCASENFGTCDCTPVVHPGIVAPAELGDVVIDPDVPDGEILPQVWESLEVTIATSIQAVAEKLEDVVSMLPGKQGQMVFKSMQMMNAKRPVIGDYRAAVQHARQQQNLLILDVSGSMNSHTISRIIEDVVALSYTANAHMAIVSDSTTFWEPGSYDVAAVLAKATYGGTHYETLAQLMDRDWGTVITVADYDSSISAKDSIRSRKGHIDEVIDVSLVNRPTYLAECVGQLADKVTPILIGSTGRVLV